MERVCEQAHECSTAWHQEMSITEDMHNELPIKIGVRLSELQAETPSQCSQEMVSRQHEIKIGRIEIEAFDGDLNRWAAFKAMYDQLVHKKEYDAMTKFSYLLDHLKKDSEPYQIVYGFEKSSKGYEAAWQALCDTFDNEHRLVMSLIGRFLDMPMVPTKPNRSDLMTLVTRTNQLMLSLPRYNIQVDSWDVKIIGILVRKIDNRTKAKWIAANLTTDLPRLSDFFGFHLKARYTAIQDGDDKIDVSTTVAQAPRESTRASNGGSRNSSGNRSQSNNRSSNNRQSSTNWDENTKRPEKRKPEDELCPNCNKNGHRLFGCPGFLKLSIADRASKVTDLKVCIRCLRTDCAPSRCTMAACSCGKFHNKAICEIHAQKIQQRTAALTATKSSATAPAKPPSRV